MAISRFDQYTFKITCQCGHVSVETIGRFEGIGTATCSRCGAVIDLRSEPYGSTIRKLQELATELDKQARERGEIIERRAV
jgi:transcription elongation factor Elf1